MICICQYCQQDFDTREVHHCPPAAVADSERDKAMRDAITYGIGMVRVEHVPFEQTLKEPTPKSDREFGNIRILSAGATAFTTEPRPEYPHLRSEGMQVQFDSFKGPWVDADRAEECIKRLYEHVERLTTAYEEAEK